ncbi:protein-tyrosine phosphatase-like protein [Pavlovales sp. CCMP2436]|nr:protein-tyrosine phosphatase-like protein [Pavlovales sp. CCMP2436]|mmetsp:Transcript_36309/g.84241  ORF Transcript_36309/g.84241 Transcript_36309/m.84241 type:complete len:215 (+) Transcript_36309:245-889(+)
MATAANFEAVRELTTWVRPGHAHGCAPAEVVPGVWNAHFLDVDSLEKLRAVAPGVRLVVNCAPCQCVLTTSYGDGITVLAIDLEDDPDPRKYFDQGKPATSTCREPDLPLTKRCAGNAKRDFERVAQAIDATLADGGHVVVHCMASLSRSVAFMLAFLMHSHRMGLLEATAFMKEKWDATWPCDRFVFELLDYERELRAPPEVREWLRANPTGI